MASKYRYKLESRSECSEFLVWLLQELNRAACTVGSKKRNASFMESLQGEVEVTTYTKSTDSMSEGEVWTPAVKSSPFTFLSLDIPPCPLFKDSQGGAIIPQIPIFEIMNKFDGHTVVDQVTATTGHVRKSYKIKKLPRYLILQLHR